MGQVVIQVSGLVQGVFFRANTRTKAESLGLVGFVRNTADGGVEVVAEGERAQLEGLVAWCRQGPPAARVEGCRVSWRPATGEFSGFQISYH